MLEEPKIKKVDKRDKQLPQNFEQLIEMYDVEKIWPYIKRTIDYINNDLEKVTVSPTEPVNKEKVWIQKGKNLLDPNRCELTACVLNSDNSLTSKIEGGYYSSVYVNYLKDVFLKNKGKKISFSVGTILTGKQISIIIYGTRTNGSTFQEVGDSNLNSISLVISEDFTDITSIELRFNRSNTPFIDTTTTIPYIQLEFGTPTEYEPYIDKKIYFKNDNGIYEEFVNAETMGIETITNDYGEAIKFPNGTMIYKGFASLKAGDGGIEIECPVPFADTNKDSVSVTLTNKCFYTNTIMWSGQLVSNRNLGMYPYDVVSKGNPTVDSMVNFTVIGKWK